MPTAPFVFSAVSLTSADRPSVRLSLLPEASFLTVWPSVSMCVPVNLNSFFWVAYWPVM
ncbi:hypothetical protein HMPREF0970_00268 [Schaalia odontolytica F0309]|uniref:Uncharacterized protein n=1 Tax=Schaalia odontolytica F0309 TaxID=649742 RepID=D4TWF8_9ACTO|nr:hypothetical protein HMPREF0970_00268 [Schaalia odontolytica F0309]